ncbi:phosphatase PAP2 family protein [Brevundimonas bacteroides]|uniref:phosphatase PAP2 family protein n=1 Tax=Brevundimonas bacteroides TaxID=74311 RepID=UPI0004953A25|nr:phosphatase PAP2 family protein [Brevundimonas bacteroides]
MREGVLAIALVAAVAGFSRGATAQEAMGPAAPAAGYLDERVIGALAAAVPAPAAPGSPQDVADRTASERSTALEDTDRWLLATRHAELRPGVALAHFDCALGFRIDAAEAPRLAAILTRVLHDANEAAELAKARGHRPRPVGDDPDRRACQAVTSAQRATASHPSGSASVGSAYGTVLAALVPDRAEAVTAIGRQIAISRMVCGMHYPSDVEDGAALGAVVAEAVITTPAFQADATAARVEIAAARTAARTSPACAAERAALAIPLP